MATALQNPSALGSGSESPGQPGIGVAWIAQTPGGGDCRLHVDRQGNAYVGGNSQVVKFDPNGQRLWVAPFTRPGGAYGGMGWVTALTVDEAGNVYVTGYSAPEPFDYDCMTIKLDAHGNRLWTAHYGLGDFSSDTAVAVGLDHDGNVYVGGTEGDNTAHSTIVILKYNSAGSQLWEARYQGVYTMTYCRALKVSSVGEVAVIGIGNSQYTYQDWIILKYTSEGLPLWGATFGAPDGDDQPEALVTDASGGVFVTGFSWTNYQYQCTTIAYSARGRPQWVVSDFDPTNTSYGGHAIALDSLGNIVITATGDGGDSEELRGFATFKYDPFGRLLWSTRFQGTHHGGSGFALDAEDNVYLTAALGADSYAAQPVTIKYNSNGRQVGLMPFPLDGHWGELSTLALGPNPSVYAAGTLAVNGSASALQLVKYVPLVPASDGATGCAGSLDPAFDASPGVWPDLAPQAITSIKVEPDGSVIIAGAFEQVQGVECGSPARLGPDGRLDPGYRPDPADIVSHTEVTQPDGKRVVIVRNVDSEHPFGTVFRYLPDGSRDRSFLSSLPADYDARALALQPDGRILVAGGIYPFDSSVAYDRVRQPVMRLNPDGWVDWTFCDTNEISLCPGEATGEPLGVYDMIRQPDGKIYIGGFFTAVNGVRRTVVARFNVDGTLDAGFEPDIEVHTAHDPGIVETVTALALAPDGKLYVAGFLEFINGLTRPAIARLHTASDSCPGVVAMADSIRYVRENAGAVAVSFRRAANTNGTAVVGYSTHTWPTHPNTNYHFAYATAGADYLPQTNTVTFAPGEVLKTVWIPVLNDRDVEASEVFAVNLDDADGTRGAVFDNDAASTRVMIWDDDHVGRPGSVDETFMNTGWNGAVSALALAHDGTVFVGGSFTLAGGLQGLARCAPNGNVLPGFAPVLDGAVHELAVEASGKLVVAGSFTRVNGVSRPGLARLHPDGTLDLAFNPILDGEVWELELMPGGQMMVAGPFLNVSGQRRMGLARLNSDGSLDPTFNAGSGIDDWTAFHRMNDLLVLPDGKVVVTGWFRSFNGTECQALVRLNADGSLDATFAPTVFQAGDYGTALLRQPDGRLLVSGWIRYGLGGVYHVGLVRLNPDGSLDTSLVAKTRGDGSAMALQPDGKILFGGVTRLHPDGTDDLTWFAGSGFGQAKVAALVLLPYDKVMVGGAFTQVNGFPYPSLAVLNGDATGRLVDALGTAGLTWTTGSKPWFGQTAVSYDGAGAAQSATQLTCDDHAWLKTTVTGPGTVSFRWKADIEGAESFLGFYVAGGSGVWPEAAQVHATTDWQLVTCSFGPGEHDLFWVAYGNCAGVDQQMTAWLDTVRVSAPGEGGVGSPWVHRVIARPGVQLVATPPEGVSVYAIEDEVTPSAMIANISHGGVFDAARGKVKFGPFYDHEPRTFSYSVLIPPGCVYGVCGVFTFAGLVSADGINMPVAGDAQMRVIGLHPADFTPANQEISIGEVTAYGAAWRRGATWAVGPVPIPMDYVTRAAALWRGGECYVIDSAATNAPLCWVGCEAPGAAVTASVDRPSPIAGDGSAMARREVPSWYVPGQPAPVSIMVVPTPGSLAYAVEDRVPSGWTVTVVNEGGDYDAANGRVKWGPFVDGAARTLCYLAVPPPTASGEVFFSGAISVDGVSVPVAGLSGMAAQPLPSLAEALDAETFEWRTGEASPWLAQTRQTHDGIDAAQSGLLIGSGESWLETTVTGPGVIRYWWSVSTLRNWYYLSFRIDGQLMTNGTGEMDWRRHAFYVPAGPHTLRWDYVRDDEETGGTDAAWLDEVVFTPGPPEAPVVVVDPRSLRVAAGDDVTLFVVAEGTEPFEYQWRLNGELLPNATGQCLTLIETQPAQAGQYDVLVSNLAGQVLSAPGTLTVQPSPMTWDWARAGGGSGIDGAFAVAVDGAGEVWVAGRFSGTATFGTNTLTSSDGEDLFLARCDAQGNVLELHDLTDSGSPSVTSLDNAPGGQLVLAGYFRYEMTIGTNGLQAPGFGRFVAKLDRAGRVLWAQALGGVPGIFEDSPAHVAVDPSGQVYVLALFQGQTTVGNQALTSVGGTDFFLARIASDGGVTWVQSFGTTNWDRPRSVATDSVGHLYFSGEFDGALVVGTNTLVGRYQGPGSSGYGVFIAKCNAAGEVLWTLLGETNHLHGYELAVDAADHLYARASYYGTTAIGASILTECGEGGDYFVARYDPDGRALWGRSIGNIGFGSAFGYRLKTGGADRVYLQGPASGTVIIDGKTVFRQASASGFLAAWNSAGRLLWTERLPWGVTDFAPDPAGNVALAGVLDTPVTLGTNVLVSSGATDAFVARLANVERMQFVSEPARLCVRNGVLHLQLSGCRGNAPVIIEASTNLIDWSGLWTNVGATGTIELPEALDPNRPARFYRARTTLESQ